MITVYHSHFSNLFIFVKVSSTAEDPIPGWVSNVYGANGILAAAGIGLLRTMNTDGNVRANLIPCDYLVNAIIAAAWYTASTWLVDVHC